MKLSDKDEKIILRRGEAEDFSAKEMKMGRCFLQRGEAEDHSVKEMKTGRCFL